MEKARKSTYWLILPGILLVIGLLAWVIAPTQSRYNTVAGWQISISQVDEALNCDLLTQEGQRIRLQDMSVADTCQIPLTLTTAGRIEQLEMTVESQYLTVDFPSTGVYQETVVVPMTLAVTDEAKQLITAPTDASAKLTLTWEDGQLQGEILMRLTPVPEETLPENGGNSESGNNDPVDAGENTENTDGGNDAASIAEETTNDTDENTPSTEENTNAGDSTPGTGEDTNTGDSTPGTGEDTNTGDSTLGTGEDTNTGETTPDTDETVAPENDAWAQGMKKFAAQGTLPLLIDVPDECNRIQVKMAMGENLAGEFPASTRYSTDGGASYTLLYDPGVIDFVPEEGVQSITLLIDCSGIQLDTASMLTLTVSALQGENVLSSSSVLTQAGLALPAVQFKTEAPMVTKDKSIQFLMPVYGNADSVVVQRLSLNSTEEENMPAIMQENGMVTISSDSGQAKAGTYKAVLTWSWNELQVARQEFVFYVNYTPYVHVEAEQTNTENAPAADAA